MGEEITRLLAQSGCRVAVIARRQPVLDALAERLNSDGLAAHVYAYAHDECPEPDAPQ